MLTDNSKRESQDSLKKSRKDKGKKNRTVKENAGLNNLSSIPNTLENAKEILPLSVKYFGCSQQAQYVAPVRC